MKSSNVRLKRSKKRDMIIGQTILNLIFIVLVLAVVIPFVLLVMVSLSNEKDISYYGYQLIPKRIDFTAYKYVFRFPDQILQAYKITGIFSIVCTFEAILLTSLFAYPISRKDFKVRNTLCKIVYFSGMIQGGLVPFYILITQWLNVDNTIWVYIIMGIFGVWNGFMLRAFFNGIPESIVESAKMDGASEFRILFQFMMPLSKPILATIAFNTFIGKWNDWQTSMLYIDKQELYSLQYMLQRYLNNLTVLENYPEFKAAMEGSEILPAETIRMAMAVVVAGPALIIFPLFQKYFVKGMVLGSVKG